MSYNFKYLKYKQKYLDLKKLIGAGIDAICEDDESKIKITYKLDGEDKELYYYYLQEGYIGQGTSGAVYKIKKQSSDDDTEYIFKKKKYKAGYSTNREADGDIVIEGKQSDKLKEILDENSQIIFQGKIKHGTQIVGEFLISRYNGVDLQKTYSGTTYFNQTEKIQYIGNILCQILDNIRLLNNSKLYHNDIKLQNIVMDSSMRVRLIDFGLLDVKSEIGTLFSMSYKSICMGHYEYFDQKYKDIIDTLLPSLKDTDIFGFFYCCIDLLYLLNDMNSGHGSFKILLSFNIRDNFTTSLLNLFKLYYFISPTNYKIENDGFDYSFFPTDFPDIDTTRQHFNFRIDDDNINLYRYILFIYNFLVKAGIDQIIGEKNLKNFLVGISVCLLPTFDYKSFDFTNLCQYLVKKIK